MHRLKWWLVLINLIGGPLVLGSYALGVGARPDAAEVLWGDVPSGIRPAYTVNMILAALGYFAFSLYLLLSVDAERARIAGRRGFAAFNMLYAAILFPSALWMPMTFLAIDAGTPGMVWAVRALLALIGLASLGLLVALWSAEPIGSRLGRSLALVGAVFFCLQTVVLDAVVWSSYFGLQ